MVRLGEKEEGAWAPGDSRWPFHAALGSNRPIAIPDLLRDKGFLFMPKVKLEVKARPAGGCG